MGSGNAEERSEHSERGRGWMHGVLEKDVSSSLDCWQRRSVGVCSIAVISYSLS